MKREKLIARFEKGMCVAVIGLMLIAFPYVPDPGSSG
jgi:hypothetical protein